MAQYGRPKITAELRRRGWKVNPKRVYRLMREDNLRLLCVRKRNFVVTTDSHHTRQVYPNLARAMVVRDIDQLWAADITYIRLQSEFVYLGMVIEAYLFPPLDWLGAGPHGGRRSALGSAAERAGIAAALRSEDYRSLGSASAQIGAKSAVSQLPRTTIE